LATSGKGKTDDWRQKKKGNHVKLFLKVAVLVAQEGAVREGSGKGGKCAYAGKSLGESSMNLLATKGVKGGKRINSGGKGFKLRTLSSGTIMTKRDKGIKAPKFIGQKKNIQLESGITIFPTGKEKEWKGGKGKRGGMSAIGLKRVYGGGNRFGLYRSGGDLWNYLTHRWQRKGGGVAGPGIRSMRE